MCARGPGWGTMEAMFDAYAQWHIRRRLSTRAGRTKLLATLATAVFFAVVAGVFGFGILLAWYAKDLPRPDRVRRVEGLSTVVLDRTGETIYDIFEAENRIPVKFEDMPLALRQATIAVEDKDFYKHQGLSTSGIFRAFLNIITLRSFQGGSTLTQQLVKNVLLTNERTLTRKLKEAVLATQIERKYTKDEILQMYLNEAPYGGTAVGVEAAAKYYFNKHAKELTVPECVVLAGLPQSPSMYTPFGKDPKAYVARTQHVLRRMRDDGYISQAQETELRKQIETIKFTGSGDESLKAPHFVAYVKELLIEKFGRKAVDAGGLKVTTTLDLALQTKAQAIVKEEVDKIKYLKATNGAAVVLDPKTGEILTMVGSKDYAATESGGYKFNVATQGLRQPGSTMKPITYAAALKKGYTAATMLMDVETKYPSGDTTKPEYNPKNYDLKYRGPIQLRYALANSVNTVAVKVSALVGVRDSLRTAFDMGLTTLEPTEENLKRIGLSLTLGGGEVRLLELTGAFGVFATGGFRQESVAILKVEDAKGKVLYEYKTPTARRAMPADVCYIISSILSDNDARKAVFGERSYLYIPGRTAAVKTGTTDDKRDNWTVGYTPSVVVGVWVGNNDNSAMNQQLASGVTGAAPIWNRIIREALAKKPDEPFSRPDTVVEAEVDAFGGGTPISGGTTRKEYFVRGTEPAAPASIYKQLKISRHDTNKLASQIEIARGQYDSKTFVVIAEQDPVSGDGKNRWQEGIDSWVASQSDAKYHPPRETYEDPDRIAIVVKSPGDMAQYAENDIKVEASAISVNTIRKIEILLDGKLVRDTTDSKYSGTVTVPDGSHIMIVRTTDDKGLSAGTELRIGIKTPYATPTPIPPSPTPIPVVTTTPVPISTP